ncbi:hypothetical protein LSH36_320g02097 [Paralvinella palmiformis]|uniref:EGF-like domain-containing protein n=1 Tax=Paralvinella palmiformis TaxID=53620 RepID=A0AAD9JGT6_9ANNE|nr:hypothetical protein LSH36_320g02097 [Paralvinella palmiformis]
MRSSLIIFLVCSYLGTGGGMLADEQICRGDTDCGWNSYCDHGQCWCERGFQRQTGSKHCLDATCNLEDCVQCLDQKFCKRCVAYLLTGTGQCISECNTRYTLLIQGDETGRVCQANSQTFSMVYVSIIVAACAAVLFIILIVMAVHYKMRTHKEHDLRLKLLAELLKKEKQNRIITDAKLVGEIDDYSNDSTVVEGRLQRLHYYHQVLALAPHIDTFAAMLRDAKLKNLVHQLCRVVTVIGDHAAPMPTDGNLLLDWARQMLTDYKRFQRPNWNLPDVSPMVLSAISRSLPSGHFSQRSGHFSQHSTSTPQRSSNQWMEADRELGEIAAVHLDSDVSEPIEV